VRGGGVSTVDGNPGNTAVFGWPSSALGGVSTTLAALVTTQPPGTPIPGPGTPASEPSGTSLSAVNRAGGRPLPGLVVPLASAPLRLSAPASPSAGRRMGSTPVAAVVFLLLLGAVMVSYRIIRLGTAASLSGLLSRSRRSG
jgi:hypothetical protein